MMKDATLEPTTTTVAPNWFRQIPMYANAQPVTIASAALASLGTTPPDFYVSSSSSLDPTGSILDFYTRQLAAAGWQLIQKQPLSSDEQAGQQLVFNQANHMLIVLVATAAALQGNPRTALLADQLSSDRQLLLLIAKTEPAQAATPIDPPTTGLPAGVAAQNLSFDFGDGWIARGQITYPASQSGPFPTVILVHGSGLNDMDETLPEQVSQVPGGSKFFLPIAYYLPTRGLAVVRYNKRGVIGLGPQVSDDPKFNQLAKPFTQHTQDAAFVLKLVRQNPLVDPRRVILLGHSEGTLNISLIANSAAGQDVAGLVLMGVAGFDARTILQYQLVDRPVEQIQQEMDTDRDGKVSAAEFIRWLGTQSPTVKAINLQSLFEPDKDSALKYRYKPAIDTNGDNILDLKNELRPYLQAMTGMDNFPHLNGLPAARIAFFEDWGRHGSVTSELPGYQKPILMMNGEGDIQTVIQGARAADAALTKTGHPDHTLLTYPGLGHSFYPVKGIEQPLGTPQANVLKDLGDWLSKRYLNSH
jgi:pimeloyl-ACP methyl ester carboxylesterase